MPVTNPWAKHHLGWWQEQVGNAALPLWLRVAALAFGTHRRNGHAPQSSGESLRLAFRIVDKTTGEIWEPTPSDLSRAIKTAITYGFLSPTSSARCLVTPAHAVSGGVIGTEREVCKQRHRTAR